MAKILLESWREGLEKISLTKLQVDVLGMSLKQAKFNVDHLLEDEKVIIEIDDLERAGRFIQQADKLGTVCRLVED